MYCFVSHHHVQQNRGGQVVNIDYLLCQCARANCVYTCSNTQSNIFITRVDAILLITTTTILITAHLITKLCNHKI